jgi:hypothetical protein
MKKRVVLLVGCVILGACSRGKPEATAPRFSLSQLAAVMPADLGASALDVSAYPQEQQGHYRLFAARCSQCHTLARAINSSFVTREDWNRYVERMHARLPVERARMPDGGEVRLVRRGEKGFRGVIPASEIPKIIDFLAYDSKVRKIDHAQAFQVEQTRLSRLFAEIQKEKQTPPAQSAEE